MTIIELASHRKFIERPENAHRSDGYVYIVEFSDSTTKVGRTEKPNNRLEQHRGDGRKFGLTIARWWVSEIHRDHAATEKSLKVFAATAGVLQGGSEYFSGLNFESAVSYVEDLGIAPSTEEEARDDNERHAAYLEGLKGMWGVPEAQDLMQIMVARNTDAAILSLFFDPRTVLPSISGESSSDAAEELVEISKRLSELTGKNAAGFLELSWFELLSDILDKVVATAKRGIELKIRNEGREDLLGPWLTDSVSSC